MAAYYNEIDKFAAAWLRNLIAAGHIAPGDVDERSIQDVHPEDIKGYDQCHFFAGVGVWSLALRRAGWSDDRPIWTGSCPCQPFSAAGKGAAFDDERHLWPDWYWLIQQCRPTTIVGEQVASKDADPWIDLVQADLETMGYAVGAIPFPSAGVSAPHIRDRLYWVANANSEGSQRGKFDGQRTGLQRSASERSGQASGMANTDSPGLESLPIAGRDDAKHHAQPCGELGGLADTQSERRKWGAGSAGIAGGAELEANGADGRPGPTNGPWGDADWLLCRDGKWRPVEPGTFPLVDGAPSRVGPLRAYGNAINAEAARIWIESVMESMK